MKSVKLEDLKDVKYPITIDPTNTYYTSASDGFISVDTIYYSNNYPTLWAMTSVASASIIDTNNYLNVGQIQTGGQYAIYRLYLYFDTSDLGSSATITSAILSGYGYTGSDYSYQDFNLQIQNGQPTYPHSSISTSDYNKSNYSGNGGTLNTSGWNSSGYNSINLNATGISWINKTGITKLCIRNDNEISGTTPTTYEQVAIYAYEQGIGYRPKLEVTYTVVVPTVTTDAASSIGATSATLNGSITNTGGATVDYYGFVVNTTAIADPANTDPSLTGHLYFKSAVGDYGVSSQNHAFTGLAIGTTYHFRFCAHNSEGWSYGADTTFTTTAKATILSQNATLITATSARLQSYLSNTGGTGITCSVQFGYGTTSQSAANFHLYTTKSGFAGNYTSGTYPYLDITSLTPSTRYYYRVQARNGAGNATCTLEQSFLTESGVGTPSNLLGTPSTTSIVLTWTKGLGASNSYLVYKIGNPPTTVTNGTLIYSSTASTYTLSGLIVGQTYGFSVWGWDSATTWSSSYASYVVTTEAAVSQDITNTSISSNFFFEPSLTAFNNNPAKILVDFLADATSMPRTTAYFGIAMLFMLILSILGFYLSHGSLVITAICLVVGSLAGLFMGLLSYFIFVPVIIVSIIMIVMRERV